MKIIVRTKEKKLRLWLPGGLLYGRISARIAIASITRYAPDFKYARFESVFSSRLASEYRSVSVYSSV